MGGPLVGFGRAVKNDLPPGACAFGRAVNLPAANGTIRRGSAAGIRRPVAFAGAAAPFAGCSVAQESLHLQWRAQ